MRKIFIVFCLLGGFYLYPFAQESFLETNDKAEVLALSEEVTHTFKVEKGLLEVLTDSRLVLESLSGQTIYNKVDFFDDQSEIIKASVKDGRGKRVKVFPVTSGYDVDEYFYSDASIHILPVPFSESGDRKEIQTSKKYKDVRYFTREGFHTSYPVLKKKMTFVIPTSVDVELVEFNFDGYDILKEETVHGGFTHISYTLEEVDMYLQERYSYGMPSNFPHILVVPKSFRDADGQKNVVFESTKDLYAWYRSIANLVKNDPNSIRPIVKQITARETNDLDKIKSLYYWVQDNIRYIAFEDGIAGFKPDEAQNVCQKKYGDCKGMANLLKVMLQEAGYDARLTWVGTNRLPYSYSTPSLGVDNHMITTLFHDGETYYLDPTEKYNAFGEYAFRIQGKEVLIEQGEDFLIQRVPVSTSEDNKEVVERNYQLTEDLNLKGRTTQKYFGESRTYLLYALNNLQQSNLDKAIKAYVTNRDKNIVAGEIETSSIQQREDVFQLDFDIEVRNHISEFGEEVYIDLDLDKELDDMDMETDRVTDYIFPHRMKQIKTINLEIPDGFTVTILPEAVEERSSEYLIRANYEKSGNKITYTKEIEIINGLIPVEYFEEWNTSIERLNDFYDQQIVLKKD